MDQKRGGDALGLHREFFSRRMPRLTAKDRPAWRSRSPVNAPCRGLQPNHTVPLRGGKKGHLLSLEFLDRQQALGQVLVGIWRD